MTVCRKTDTEPIYKYNG